MVRYRPSRGSLHSLDLPVVLDLEIVYGQSRIVAPELGLLFVLGICRVPGRIVVSKSLQGELGVPHHLSQNYQSRSSIISTLSTAHVVLQIGSIE